ncbi:MAG: MATE family efflux transporter [Methanoregula sp.]|nr:MATE family efflux transporter [Methanoregula sp.]
MADTDNYLTEGRLLSGLFTISLPIIASNLLQSVLEVVDLYFVGRLGSDAIAGVAMSTTLIFVLATFVIGLVTATTAFIARHYGAHEYETIGTIVEHALYIGFVFSLILAVVGHFYAKDLLLLMGANDAVATLGSAYLSVLFLGVFTMIELWIATASFQSCGNSMTPMLVMVGVNILNMILNPLLIFGFGPVGGYGVAGSALATILSRGTGLVVCLYLLIRYAPQFRLPVRWRIDYGLIRRILEVAIPNSVQSGLRSGTFLVMMTLVAAYGTSAISGYGIAERLELIALMPGFAIATATAVIVGQNLGAKRPDRAEEGVKLSLILYGAIMITISLIYWVFAEQLLWFFDPSGASELVGASYFRMVAPFYVIMAVSIILSFAMNGAGDTRKPMYATLISMVFVQIPLAYFLQSCAGMGITGIWTAIITGIILQAILLFVMYREGGWKRVALY